MLTTRRQISFLPFICLCIVPSAVAFSYVPLQLIKCHHSQQTSCFYEQTKITDGGELPTDGVENLVADLGDSSNDMNVRTLGLLRLILDAQTDLIPLCTYHYSKVMGCLCN